MPEVRRESKRQDAEARDAVEREAEHLAERVLRLSGEAPRAIVEHLGLLEADPGHHPAHEPVGLAQLAQRDDDPAAHEPEVARVERDLDRDHRGEDPVEPPRGDELEPGLPFAPAPPAVDDVEPLAPLRDHLEDDLGRVLEVGVHHDDGLAARVVDAGGDGRLVPEVSGEGQDPVARVLRPRCRAGAPSTGRASRR